VSQRSTIVISATPTPNGDLHLGHMAGPYLAGDVYARYLRANGQPVVFSTCTDDSQTYVVSTARRRGTTPEELCVTSTAAIQRSVDAMGVSMGPLPPIDEGYRAAVLDFVTALYQAGRFELRTVKLPYAERAGSYLCDGLVKGECPACFAESCGGACEACGHPNHFDELGNPRSTMDPSDPVVYREADVLVLPMERYRERLVAYYKEREDRWRPHSMQLIREILAKPLPDVPVTFPTSWGVPAPFPETPGQVLYPWVEAMPASMYSTWWAARSVGMDAGETVDALWRAERGARLVYFHGFDNVYFWGMVDLVLLMAHGDRYVLPDTNVCNEFYELENDKFSTSRNHVIWSADLVAEVPRDLVRFYLALTCPENQRTNFAREALDKITAQRLVRPWNALVEQVDDLLALHGFAPLPVSEDGRRRAASMVQRFRLCYELPTFSLHRAADGIMVQLDRLHTEAAGGQIPPGDLMLQVRTLLACASPILVDATAGLELSLRVEDVEAAIEVEPLRLPRLSPRLVSGVVCSDRHRHSRGEAIPGGVR
jgi:methionyl-tRNA synthetase